MVRHGESHHAVDRTAAGLVGCRGLTDAGVRQAQLLADRLAREVTPGALLVSSPVTRAVQTADVVAAALAPADVVRSCDACEMHLGEGDGLPRAAFEARYGRFDPVTDPRRPVAPGGDSWTSFQGRVDRVLDALVADGRDVVLVTHAGFLVAAFLRLMAVPPSGRARLEPAFASTTEWTHHRGTSSWTLERYNDTAHLAAPAAAGGTPRRTAEQPDVG